MKAYQESKVFTPEAYVKRMIGMSFKLCCDCKSVYDPACGDGNILVEVAKFFKSYLTDDEAASRIYGTDIVPEFIDRCKERLLNIFTDLKDKSILDKNIQVKDPLKTCSRHYDLIIMNPPYERDLCKVFLDFAIHSADEVITLQPMQFLYRHSDLRNIDVLTQSNIQKYCKRLIILNPNLIWEDRHFVSPVGIFHLSKDKSGYLIINDEMTDENYYVDSVDKIYKHYLKMKKFIEKLEILLNKTGSIREMARILEGPDPNKPFYADFAQIRGHTSETDKDLYNIKDFAVLAYIGQKAKSIEDKNYKDICFSFDTESEAQNFIDFLQTDFARLCIYINKHGLHARKYVLEKVPKLDFTKKWTDEELFNLIGCDNPNILPKYY